MADVHGLRVPACFTVRITFPIDSLVDGIKTVGLAIAR